VSKVRNICWIGGARKTVRIQQTASDRAGIRKRVLSKSFHVGSYCYSPAMKPTFLLLSRAAALLLSHVSIQICSFVAPCRWPILIATPLHQSLTWCTNLIGGVRETKEWDVVSPEKGGLLRSGLRRRHWSDGGAVSISILLRHRKKPSETLRRLRGICE
jgi:hypothetical protein